MALIENTLKTASLLFLIAVLSNFGCLLFKKNTFNLEWHALSHSAAYTVYKKFGAHAFPALFGFLGFFVTLADPFFCEFLVYHTSHGGFLKLHFFSPCDVGMEFLTLSLQRNAVRF